MKDIFVSSSPHIRSPEDIPWIMRQVMYALMPGAFIGVYFFGMPAIKVIAVSIASCVAVEALWQRVSRQRITVNDWSAALTGLLLAMNLPSGLPWWMVVIGSAVAIIFGKQVYGGLGNNPF
ncbi:MAG TPA: RnfABCDGE type electron transport complex subunit D, partial [Deltaproteobacteria bacterium]|nr:RnfABCDGE type electron transport complex subunit D [Deltaproteobacteria bacterium]